MMGETPTGLLSALVELVPSLAGERMPMQYVRNHDERPARTGGLHVPPMVPATQHSARKSP